MTALAGLWRFDGRPDAAEDCAAMLAAQTIYGPHNQSQWSKGPLALGRNLFQSLPEDAYDTGPIFGGDGRLVLVADIRLDNRGELIAELALSQAQARTMCDAALLLAALERWDDRCLDRIVGDFAFALWDVGKRRLFLARDFLGQRPLHFHRGTRFFAFASMPKGLHALADVPYAPDEQRVAEFLALFPEGGSASFYRGIERVEPGHAVVVTQSGVSTRRYWNPKRRTINLASTDAYGEALRHHLDEATRARLRGTNGSVGAHLSAGFDSAAVTATAARLLAPVGGRVSAFTSVPRTGYDGPQVQGRIGDEGPLASATAALYPNIEHVLVRTNGRTPLDGLDRAFFVFERPLLNICNYVWVSAINDEARRRGLTVLLTGEVGNLTISTDGREYLPELISQGRWARWFKETSVLVRNGKLRWRGALAFSVGPWLPRPLWIWLNRTFRGYSWDIKSYTAVNRERFDALDLKARAAALGLDLVYRPRKDSFESRLWALRRFDMGNYYQGTLGGWGIDLRNPAADRRVVEFCLSVPMEQFLSDGEPRALARRAFADRLPAEVLNERRTGLQAVDWHEALTAARPRLIDEVERLAAHRPSSRTLNTERMRRLVNNWPKGRWETNDVVVPYRLALLRGVSAGHFLRKASGANG